MIMPAKPVSSTSPIRGITTRFTATDRSDICIKEYPVTGRVAIVTETVMHTLS